MPLYQVQDNDRPMWVIAGNYGNAVSKWRAIIAKENNQDIGEVDEPQGVHFICNDDEIVK